MIWILLRREYGASVAIDDKYDGLQRLVQMGKEKGYVLYDEVSEVLPGDVPGGADLEDVLAGLDIAGIEILEEPKDFEKKLEEGEEVIDLELPAGVAARRSTIRSACTCARWARCPCSRAKAKSRSPGASSAARTRS